MFASKPHIKKTCMILCLAGASLLASFFLPLGAIRYAAAAILTVAAAVTYLLVKKRCILSFNRRRVLLLVTAFVALFLMLYYVSGIVCGYYPAVYPFSFSTLYRYILPIFVIIFASEVIRHLSLAIEGKAVLILSYLLCVLSDLAIDNGFVYFESIYRFMDFVGMVLFPALTSNLLLHYLSKHYGMASGIVYRCVLYLYSYLIPIIPNTPLILPSFVLILLPLIMLAFIRGLFEKKRTYARQKRSKLSVILSCVAAVLMIAFVMLISCQFRYGIIVIGTGSMAGEINRGDAVVFESYAHCDVAENDVIIFKKDAQTRIVHRVIDTVTVQGQTCYVTKGDANRDPDPGFVTQDQILGVVRFKILYIGYPSLWLNDIFHK